MTEAEWQSCEHPFKMLDFLRGKATARKVRWFMAACCRCAWHLMDEQGEETIEALEQFADGLIDADNLNEYHESAERYGELIEPGDYPVWNAHWAILCASDVDPTYASYPDSNGMRDLISQAKSVSAAISGTLEQEPDGESLEESEAPQDSEICEEHQLIRDIFGNPFRRPIVHVDWLAWNDATVRKIAQAMYDERAFERLPILADALEDAGCDNTDILDHCREPGVHVRGCWVVDLLLGKE